MLRAFGLALTQLFSSRILSVVGTCALLSALVFIGIYYAMDYGVTWLCGSSDSIAITSIEVFATLMFAWFLFPVVASLLIGLFLDHVCSLVEKTHYPDLPPAPGVPISQSVLVALNYTYALLVVNLLLLLLLFFPAFYAVAWIILNGYLLGREYVELVALRRLPRADVQSLRKRHRSESTLIGSMVTLLMAIPLLNLIVPVLATAVTVHRFHDWQRQVTALENP